MAGLVVGVANAVATVDVDVDAGRRCGGLAKDRKAVLAALAAFSAFIMADDFLVCVFFPLVAGGAVRVGRACESATSFSLSSSSPARMVVDVLPVAPAFRSSGICLAFFTAAIACCTVFLGGDSVASLVDAETASRKSSSGSPSASSSCPKSTSLSVEGGGCRARLDGWVVCVELEVEVDGREEAAMVVGCAVRVVRYIQT